MPTFVATSVIREKIVEAILASFKQSMPIYAEMMAVAQDINNAAGPQEDCARSKTSLLSWDASRLTTTI